MTSTASTRRRGSTPLSLKALLIAGFLLGAAATVLVVVFSDQVRWLRIGVLLALWAALCAAFAVTRSRREAQSVAAREAEITRTYQLELHREVSARREYESALTDQVRTEVESKHADELAAVRAQLERLTAVLSNLLDGDVLVERLTLSAESTRLRGLTEAGRNRLAGRSHPELGRQQSDDEEAIDAELVDDELPDTAEREGMTAADSDPAPVVEADPASTVEADEADSREGDDSIEPAATTAQPVLPSRLSAAPWPDAPSTAWTRRHRKDVVQAAAVVAADRSARERSAAASEAGERIRAVEPVGAVPYSTFAVVARGAVQMPPLADDAVGADSEPSQSPAESPSAAQMAPAGGRGGHELDSNAHDDAGSARISVAQLLAALGSNAEPSHGRRRAAD